MQWEHGIACFFGGAILTNAVPHFVQGVCGDRFPTPFAKPPGRGLSTPVVNVVWALLNLAVGYGLSRFGRSGMGSDAAVACWFAGVAVVSVFSALHFAGKHTP